MPSLATNLGHQAVITLRALGKTHWSLDLPLIENVLTHHQNSTQYRATQCPTMHHGTAVRVAKYRWLVRMASTSNVSGFFPQRLGKSEQCGCAMSGVDHSTVGHHWRPTLDTLTIGQHNQSNKSWSSPPSTPEREEYNKLSSSDHVFPLNPKRWHTTKRNETSLQSQRLHHSRSSNHHRTYFRRCNFNHLQVHHGQAKEEQQRRQAATAAPTPGTPQGGG